MKWIGIAIVSVVCWVSTSMSASVVDAGQPLSVLVTLRGKKYSISNVSTVEEARQKVEEQSGVSLQKQAVLFGGSKLKSTDVLDEVGVSNGAVLNMVPKKKGGASASASSSASSSSTSTSSSSGTSSSTGSSPSSLEAMESAAEAVKGMLEQAGVDPDQLSQLMGGADGKMPDMQESMEMMQNLMSSPMFQEFMNDPAKLEQSRKMILENEMMKGMMAGLPGFDEILNDPDQWRETMQAAANMYKSMGSSLMSAMMGAGGDSMNQNNNWGMPPSSAFGGLGGFDMAGATATTAPTALDELSEGED